MTQPPHQQQNDFVPPTQSLLDFQNTLLSMSTLGNNPTSITSPLGLSSSPEVKLQMTTPGVETNNNALIASPQQTRPTVLVMAEKRQHKECEKSPNKFTNSPKQSSIFDGHTFSVPSPNKIRRIEVKQDESLSLTSSCSGDDEYCYDGGSSGSEVGSVGWSQQGSQEELPGAHGPVPQVVKREMQRLQKRNWRAKKLEETKRLENRHAVLQNENMELEMIKAQLLEDVQHLKLQVQEHAEAGCSLTGEDSTPSNS